MTVHLLLILAAAALFFAAIPAVGAFVARDQWRRFRRAMTAASLYPIASPALVAWAARGNNARPGRCRFFGTLEAIQGEDRVWIRSGRFSVAADLRGVRVFLIPDDTPDDGAPARGRWATSLASVPWNRIHSLPEGTPMFVGGGFVVEEGRLIFHDRAETPLLLVIHDCSRESILARAIGSGRQRNEYINSLTLPSAGIGSLVLLLLAFTFLGIPERLSGLIAFTAALAPLVPFLPPGFLLYFAYRSAWKKARRLRSQRDVVRLPLRFFPPAGARRGLRAALLPDMEPYVMIHGAEDGSGAVVAEGRRFALPAGTTRLEVDLPSLGRLRERGSECVVFSGYQVDGDELTLAPAGDPMAGTILVPGIPEAIARASDQGARVYTLLSGLFISLNVVINAPLLLIGLALLIR
jgi:hypothetical protein